MALMMPFWDTSSVGFTNALLRASISCSTNILFLSPDLFCKCYYFVMVVVNDFKFQLFSDKDENKTPFKEHQKDTKTYVEVETHGQYFIGIWKVWPTAAHLYIQYCVDGKHLTAIQTFQDQRLQAVIQGSLELCPDRGMLESIRHFGL